MSDHAGFELTGEITPIASLARDLSRSRGLLMILARKDFYVRYRRASFGLLWAVALPLLQAVVLAVVLSRVTRIRTEVDYPLFVFSGTLVWSYFSGIVQTGSTAIVDGADMSTRVYFPRALLPLVTVASNAVGLVLSTVILLGMAVALGDGLGPQVLLLPAALALAMALSASFALVLSALHVYFRDVRYLVQAALLAWFYVTPVFYPLALARGVRWLVLANPVTGVVEAVRAATIGADPGWVPGLASALAWTAGLLVVAALLHRRYDRVFVDLL